MAAEPVWGILIDGSAATAALVDPVPSLTRPSAAVDISGGGRVRLLIAGTDAADETIN